MFVPLILVKVNQLQAKLWWRTSIIGQEERRTDEFDSFEFFELKNQVTELFQGVAEQLYIDFNSIKEKQSQVILNKVNRDFLTKVFADKTLFKLLTVVNLHHHAINSESVTIRCRTFEFLVRFLGFLFPQLQVQNIWILEFKSQVSQTKVGLLFGLDLGTRGYMIYPQISVIFASLLHRTRSRLFFQFFHAFELVFANNTEKVR